MRFLLLLAAVVSLISCETPKYLTYDVPQYIITPHSEVMSNFTTKEKVMIEFGAPDKKDRVNNIDIIEYSLGEISRAKTKGLSISSEETNQQISVNNNQNTRLDAQYSGISMTQNNPFYSNTTTNAKINGRSNSSNSASINNVINNQYIQSTTIYSGSETYPKYAKFWLINDTVIKWESLGIDKSIPKPNPNYNNKDALQIEWKNKEIKANIEKEKNFAIISVFTSVFIVVVLGNVF